jgi:hypothetical protein
VADPFSFYFEVVAGVLVVSGYLYARWRNPRRRARRAVERLDRTPIARVGDGTRVRISGVAAAHHETTASLISGRPCLGYRLVIEISAPGTQDFVEAARGEECKSFVVEDEAGRAVVEGPFVFGLDVDDSAWTDLPPAVYQILEEGKVSLTGTQTVRFTEARLMAGDRVEVVGRAAVAIDPAGRSPDHRHPPMLVRIAGSKEDPVMVADADEPPDPAGAP